MTVWDYFKKNGQFVFGFLGVVFHLPRSLVTCLIQWLIRVLSLTPALDISDEVVVITGAGSGLGQTIAMQLAGRKCRLVLLAKYLDDLRGTVEQLKSRGCTDVFAYGCDCSNQVDIQSTAQRINDDLGGKITVLINNAGVAHVGLLADLSHSDIQDTIDVNLLAHIWFIRAFLPTLRAQRRAHVICVASVAGVFGASGLSMYCASKFGVVGLCESLAMEFHMQKLDHLQVTCICPYRINTSMFEGVRIRYQWLLPILDVEYVGRRIIGCFFSKRHIIYMPRIMYLFPVIKMLVPQSFMLSVADFFGIAEAYQGAVKAE